MGAAPKVTIATATYNCLEYTQLFLKSLRNFAKIPYHLIIVDNHSTDGTLEFLAGQKDVELIANKRNLGFGYANNQAFARTKTPYFLGINNDTFIFPGFFENLLSIAEKHRDYGEFGVNSNCIGARNPFTKELINSGFDQLLSQGHCLASTIKKYYGNYQQFFKKFSTVNKGLTTFEVPPNFIGGWCFLVRTKEIRQIGKLFDTQYKVGFWEDVDLSWRMKKQGYKIGNINGIYLHHFTHVSFKKNKLRKTDHAISRANALLFARKWDEEIKQFLIVKFSQSISLKKIMNDYFIFKVYFGKRQNYDKLEKLIKTKYLSSKKMCFDKFLLLSASNKPQAKKKR